MEMEKLVEDTPEAMRDLAEKNRENFAASVRRLQGLSYRKWVADGKPRTSLHLRVSPVE
jgi:hypothetical protein